jgi:glyoxylase-like metal-dependent hydrolase (beta-lactamase superfamily II)
VATLSVSQLGEGAMQLQSELWATNSLFVPAGRDCVLCDPSIFPDELEQIAALTHGFEHTHLLITHSDFDHTCGIASFPDARVVVGAGTAAAFADGSARRTLDQAATEWATPWEGELRVDVILTERPLSCGELQVLGVDARGHIDDGTAFILLDRRVLLPGDYASAVCYPFLLGSLSDAISAYQRLLQALDQYAIELVLPGHGPALSRERAAQICHEDVAYIRALRAAAAHGVASGGGEAQALLAAFAVEPPREARADFEAFGLRSSNARRAATEALGDTRSA